ncbi:MAG: Nrap protein-domain-containing protein, partial [Olpidium bornovanus]
APAFSRSVSPGTGGFSRLAGSPVSHFPPPPPFLFFQGDTPVSAQARPAAAYVKSLPAGAAAVSSPCDGGIAVDESRSGLAAGESDEGETGEEESADESQAAEGEADESDGNESEDFEGEDDGHYVEDDYIENDAFPEEEDRREEVAVDDDEDEEDGVGDAAAVRGKKRKGLYGVPSNEELQGLKETSELFKSNLFKFQLDELLAEVRYDYAKAKSLDAALVKLKDVLDSAVDRPGLLASPSEAAGSLLGEGITVPFPTPGPPANAQYKLAFMAPASIRVVGSYPLKAVAVTKHRFNVDVTVEMPKELFQEKDRVNHRYFYKRAYYLAVIAAELSKPERGFPGAKLEFCTDDDDDPRRPILLLRPSGGRVVAALLRPVCRRFLLAFRLPTGKPYPHRSLADGLFESKMRYPDFADRVARGFSVLEAGAGEKQRPAARRHLRRRARDPRRRRQQSADAALQFFPSPRH